MIGTAFATYIGWAGPVILVFGLLPFVMVPLVLAYLIWERGALRRASMMVPPRVSVIVPAYNEARTIVAGVRSILHSRYPDFEVIVVNDGSTDHSEDMLRDLIDRGAIRYLAKENGGKASALNAGIAVATGEVILFTDADTIFTPTTIARGVAYLADPAVGAVGGNDTPLAPQGWLQKMLVVTSHVGTGYVRRALSVARILPIIPGNLGFVRTDILRSIGGFREVWGEDLELTLRLQRERVRIVYGARAKVLSECPHSLSGLWKQRVRWMRSYIKVVRDHRAMLGRLRFGLFGPYLALLTVSMVAIPVLQISLLALLPWIVGTGALSLTVTAIIGYFGLLTTLLIATIAVALDDRPRDIVYLPYIVMLVPMSVFYNAVVLYSIWAELRARPELWNKLDRRGAQQVARIPVHAIGRRELTAGIAGLVALGAGGGLIRGIPGGAALRIHEPLPEFKLAVAIHFPDWPSWRAALHDVLAVPELGIAERIAVSAGRADWTFFRWPGHVRWWSEPQTDTADDMLETAVTALREKGHRVSAVLDVFAPLYLTQNPNCRAADEHGNRSEDIVCSTCLAEGEFGALLVDACSALAAGSAVDEICITELYYDRYCFDDRCLAAFRRATGKRGWPRRSDGRINHLDRHLTEWRSKQVATILGRLSSAARLHDKRLIADVKVSRGNFSRNSRENGQNYDLILPRVDQLVVWDYFALNGLEPDSSGKLARYLSRELGPDRYWHSIGLWDRHHHSVPADAMGDSISAAVRGGARNLWITPGRRLSRKHWETLARLKGG
ncbi:glycosyltransferase [Stakelama marina]|nr:glycosyltransferase family 2 protein [Stakelama marina]